MPEKESSAVTEIIKKYGAQLLGFIRSKVRRTEDAEDILQDVWYQTSRIADLCELENSGAWLYTVAKNKIADLHRKKNDKLLEDFSYNTDEGDFEIKDILLLDESRDPELALFKNVFWKELMDALDELPENQKEVFVLNEIEGKTMREISELQQENIKTVISRKGYAVKHLRIRLGKLYNDLK